MLINTDLTNKSLAQIVNDNFRSSKVFDKYGLDFCCKGKRTLAEACEEKSISVAEVVEDLQSFPDSGEDNDMFVSMSKGDLIDHIVRSHHTYVREHSPLVSNYLLKVSTKHGDRYPYMREVFVLFSQLRAELLAHMKDEEDIVFPLIRKLPLSNDNNQQAISLIAEMEEEHQSAGDLMLRIRQLTNDYEIPPQACNTFRVVLHLLEEFESDLHRHVFKENHILFKNENH